MHPAETAINEKAGETELLTRLTDETLSYIERTLELGGSIRGASDRALRTIRVVVE